MGHFGHATGVAAHPTDDKSFASCGADQQLLLWRVPDRIPVHRVALVKQARCVAYAADGNLVAVGFEDGMISVARPSEAQPLPALGGQRRSPPIPAQSTGCNAAIEVISFAPDSGPHGGLLAIGSHDRTVRVLELVSEPTAGAARSQGASRLKLVPRCSCSGHTGTVTQVDWSADASYLMSNDSAHEILVWSMPSGKKLAQAVRAVATVAWASWTCVLGFPVMGIFPEGANTTLVNSCHLSRDGSALLTADDAGALKLFNAPCVVEGAPYVEAKGHCSGITCARFLRGDKVAVSSGGADRSVMVWRIVPSSNARASLARTPALPGQPARHCLLQGPAKGID